MSKKIFLLVLVLLLPVFVFADDIKSSISLSKSKAFVGDEIKSVITAELPAGAFINSNQNVSFNNFDIINSAVRHVSSSPNVYELAYTLAAYNTGVFKVEPAAISYSDAVGSEKIFFTPAAQIEIESVLTYGGKDIKDIKPLKKLKIKPAYLAALIVVLMLILFLSVKLVQEINEKRRKAVVVLDPKTEALNNLNMLYEEKNKKETKFLYYRMSEILRMYIAKVRSLNTMEMTASEFTAVLRNMLPPDVRETDVKSYMKIFNLARYAGLRPSEEETEKNFKFTRELLEKL
ncbi:MAG: hypothetical protein FWC57_00575 [Endomicrobia bacterium]|nr:hypothetical protein [Endomicrobiia bacterium]